MTRQEKRSASEDKRKTYALWMFDSVKEHYSKHGNWIASITWLENRILDKIKEIPQEKELIVEATKLFRDTMNEAHTNIST